MSKDTRPSPPTLLIRGVVIPEGLDVCTYPADEFTVEETRDMSLRLKPIMVDHTAGTWCGQVLCDWVGSDGKKNIAAEIWGDTPMGLLTQKRIIHNVLKDFSLTHCYILLEDKVNGRLIHRKVPVEVSVCKEGRRATCHILAVLEYPVSKTSEIYNPWLRGLHHIAKLFAIMSAAPGSPVPDASTEVQPQPIDPQASAALNSEFNQTYQNALLEFQARENEIKQKQEALAAQEGELSRRQAEIQKLEERMIEEQRREMMAVLAAAHQQLGLPAPQDSLITEKMCSMGPDASKAVGALMSQLVTANANQQRQIDVMNRTVQEIEERYKASAADAQQKQLASSYQGLAASSSSGAKYATPNSRFATTPSINLPATSTQPLPPSALPSNFYATQFAAMASANANTPVKWFTPAPAAAPPPPAQKAFTIQDMAGYSLPTSTASVTSAYDSLRSQFANNTRM